MNCLDFGELSRVESLPILGPYETTARDTVYHPRALSDLVAAPLLYRSKQYRYRYIPAILLLLNLHS